MNSFALTIVAADRILYQGQATSCTVCTADGLQGLEAHHENLLAVLQSPSIVRYRTDSGAKRHVSVKSGLLRFARNECRLIVSCGSDMT